MYADGPEAGLQALEPLRADPRLARYHLLGAVRGEALERLGRHGEAAQELEHAAELAPTARDRDLLLARAAALRPRLSAESP
jgi:predicted RNA polymerase sigma factor